VPSSSPQTQPEPSTSSLATARRFGCGRPGPREIRNGVVTASAQQTRVTRRAPRVGAVAAAARLPLRVLIAGGGVAALEAALALRDLAGVRVAVELLAPEPQFWYRPFATIEPFVNGRVRGLDLVDLGHDCGAQVTLDALASVDVHAHVVRSAAGAEFEYDALLLASGARAVRTVEGASTFRGPADSDAYRSLLAELEAGDVRRLVFAVPGGVTWTLPLYELALQTRVHLDALGSEDIELTIVTPEAAPLALFGPTASGAAAELLVARDIALRLGVYPASFNGTELTLVPSGSIAADRVVAIPRFEGAPIDGIPYDDAGFVPTDRHGRVRGVADVFAAGDVTAFPVKQGGLAAQQADAAAETIAAAAGAPVQPSPFKPILRGLLLTGGTPTFMRAEIVSGSGAHSVVLGSSLWWPPAKIVGRYLSPFLAERAGIVLTTPPNDAGVPVAVHLEEVGANNE
jgi:sulfide:quinone oxidoreductase